MRRYRLLSAASLLGIALAMTSCGLKARPWGNDGDLPETPVDDMAERPVPSFWDLSVFSTIDDVPGIAARLGLSDAHRAGLRGGDVTIAVLDNGFQGIESSAGVILPADTRVVQTTLSSAGPSSAGGAHGLKMAEIAYAVATGGHLWRALDRGPRVLLMNTNGWTNLNAAVERLIAERVDIVLYAQVWEYGGNGDGRGFINALVNRALDAGILWVNAAGNFAGSVWRGPVRYTSDGALTMPHQGRYARFRVASPDTPVKITLAWNDFADTNQYRTARDLDLVVETEDGRVLDRSNLIQDGREHRAGERSPDGREYSAHAREIVRQVLPAGVYRVRVDVMSRQWASDSWAQVAVDGEGVDMIDDPAARTVMVPADNPRVLTVGATDSAKSSSGVAASTVTKPDVSVPSALRFSDGRSVDGTSAATAQAVGALAVWRGYCGAMDPARAARVLKWTSSGGSVSLPAVCGL